MRLHEFILTHIGQILSAWERFARSVETALPPMDSKGFARSFGAHPENRRRGYAKTSERAAADRQITGPWSRYGRRFTGPDPCNDAVCRGVFHGSDDVGISRAALECAQVVAGPTARG